MYLIYIQVEMEQMQEKVEKSQGEIYRLRAKLENTQAENENIQEEFDKLQQALSRSYAERDKYASSEDKLREELERVQVSGVQWGTVESLNMMISKMRVKETFPANAGDTSSVKQ